MSSTRNAENEEFMSGAADLRDLGRMMVAYIRPAEADGVQGFAIHGADGTVIGFAPDRSTAIGAILQNGMEFVSLN